MEAIRCGVPVLAWPIRCDQYYNAKLVVNYLKVGYGVADDLSQMVKKDDIIKGIERLMSDEETRFRMAGRKSKFDRAFPASSEFDSNHRRRPILKNFLINGTSYDDPTVSLLSSDA
ncbi:unnamed protein product [Dovyalis caffra]|uniref:Uncharacterized protein n=1 Tax=Dovyalis caffra TaxID=77055 RepID=A0AAV1SPW2_9ROSI|nr:unnamed protein product [Dovyalis caffra]